MFGGVIGRAVESRSLISVSGRERLVAQPQDLGGGRVDAEVERQLATALRRENEVWRERRRREVGADLRMTSKSANAKYVSDGFASPVESSPTSAEAEGVFTSLVHRQQVRCGGIAASVRRGAVCQPWAEIASPMMQV